MDLEKAKLLISDAIDPKTGNLDNMLVKWPHRKRDYYLYWHKGSQEATLDGEFTALELQAIACYMKEGTHEDTDKEG